MGDFGFFDGKIYGVIVVQCVDGDYCMFGVELGDLFNGQGVDVLFGFWVVFVVDYECMVVGGVDVVGD